MTHFFKLATLATFAFSAVPASAASFLTFDEPYRPFESYLEDGFKVEDGGDNFVVSGGALNFSIAYGPNSSERTITKLDGSTFDAHRLDIISRFPSVTAGGLMGDPREDMKFTGYRQGGDTVEAQASSQFGDTVFNFAPEFSGLTKLVISGFDAGNVNLDLLRDVGFLIDNVLLSQEGTADDPIVHAPLPAAGLLFVFAILGLGGVARRRDQGLPVANKSKSDL